MTVTQVFEVYESVQIASGETNSSISGICNLKEGGTAPRIRPQWASCASSPFVKSSLYIFNSADNQIFRDVVRFL